MTGVPSTHVRVQHLIDKCCTRICAKPWIVADSSASLSYEVLHFYVYQRITKCCTATCERYKNHKDFQKMQIKVKTLTGKEIEIDIEVSDKIERIKGTYFRRPIRELEMYNIF